MTNIEEDKIFVEGYFKFKHRTTGKIALSDFIMRFDMKNSKIIGGQMYENTHAVATNRN